MPTATKTTLVSLRFAAMSQGRLPREAGTSLESCWKAIWSQEHRRWSQGSRWCMGRASPMRVWDGTKHWNCWPDLRRRFGRGDKMKASVILSERSESKDPYSVQTWVLNCPALAKRRLELIG